MMGAFSSFFKKLHNALCEAYLIPVKIYRRYFSHLKPVPTCRFTPTCSQYAVEAVRKWGIIIGTALALFRLIRCNPFSKGGYDPVPSSFFGKERSKETREDKD